MLQTRRAAAPAGASGCVEMVEEGLSREGGDRARGAEHGQVSIPLDRSSERSTILAGLPASPGRRRGDRLQSDEAVRRGTRAGDLVRAEIPDESAGMNSGAD